MSLETAMMSPAADPSHRPHSVNEWGYWACTMVHNHDKQTWPARLVAHPFAAAKRMLEDVKKDSHQGLPLPLPTPLCLDYLGQLGSLRTDCNHQPRAVECYHLWQASMDSRRALCAPNDACDVLYGFKCYALQRCHQRTLEDVNG